MKSLTRVRFAPSPTGNIHVGNARTALINWLFVRKMGGELVLRFEDTDVEREVAGSEKGILDDLAWLGIDWAEGPNKEGPHGPYRQSERMNLYKEYADRLVEKKLAYPCFCTEEQLEQDRLDAQKKKIPPRYRGRCRNLTEAEVKDRLASCPNPTIRFRVDEQMVEFTDLIRGPMSFHARTIGDFILVRSDGRATYHLAVVVDDGCMGITHVIRGEEHLSNTPRHILLFRALGFPVPGFAHLGIILGTDRSKLSKRHGKTSVRQFQEEGFLPEALVHYLAQLGSGSDTGQEAAGIDELIRTFSLDRISKAPAVFDEKKLRFMNNLYVRGMPLEELGDRVREYLKGKGFTPGELDHPKFQRYVEAIRENLGVLSDAEPLMSIFFDDRFGLDSGSEEALTKDGAADLFQEFRRSIESVDEVTPESYKSLVLEIGKKLGIKGKQLYLPLRAAVTGKTAGPELDRVVPLLGKETVLKRLGMALGRRL